MHYATFGRVVSYIKRIRFLYAGRAASSSPSNMACLGFCKAFAEPQESASSKVARFIEFTRSHVGGSGEQLRSSVAYKPWLTLILKRSCSRLLDASGLGLEHETYPTMVKLVQVSAWYKHGISLTQFSFGPEGHLVSSDMSNKYPVLCCNYQIPFGLQYISVE